MGMHEWRLLSPAAAAAASPKLPLLEAGEAPVLPPATPYMEPAPASPDPAPQQEHSSPAPSPSPATAKRSAWKQPSSNGSLVDAPPPGVMDADHWPALSDAAKTKTPPPPPPSDSPKPHPDSSSTAAAASSAIANPSNSPKHSSGPHHSRQKPARRGGGGGDHSPRDHHERGTGGWDHGTGGGGRGGQRGHNNGGGRRGGGSSSNSGSGGGVAHHGGYGGRRRGGFEGFYRGPQMGIGPFMRGGAPPPPPPLAVAPPFMGPPPPPVPHMRGYAGPMMFHEMPSPVSPVSPMYYVGPPPPPEALRGLTFAPPMVGPPAYPYFHEPDVDADIDGHHAKLLKQIEFYFSKDNLCTDVFLRRKMDEEGWVDISLIAGFKKVKAITDNLQYIKETIQSSSILEVQGDKIRRQHDWHKWVIPQESIPDIPSSSAAVPRPNANTLTAHLGGMGLHESVDSSNQGGQNHHEVLPNGSTSSNDQAPAVEESADHH